MDMTPAPPGHSWGHFQFVCHLREGFWQKLPPHLPGWLVLQRQRLGVQHGGWMLTGPFLLCWPHPPRSVRVISKYLP